MNRWWWLYSRRSSWWSLSQALNSLVNVSKNLAGEMVVAILDAPERVGQPVPQPATVFVPDVAITNQLERAQNHILQVRSIGMEDFIHLGVPHFLKPVFCSATGAGRGIAFSVGMLGMIRGGGKGMQCVMCAGRDGARVGGRVRVERGNWSCGEVLSFSWWRRGRGRIVWLRRRGRRSR